MNSTHKTTNEVEKARDLIRDDMPYAEELRNLLSRALAQAWDDEDDFKEMGKAHFRTFLKTTPLGLAIVDLAYKIIEDSPPCPITFGHTRHWCGNPNCRES